jgi:hypothetical protein
MTLYANKSRLGKSRFRERNLIYLLRRNIKIIRPSDKLDSKKIDLFKVKRNIRDVSFEFKLSLIIRIYSIFHISLLEPAHPDTSKGLVVGVHPHPITWPGLYRGSRPHQSYLCATPPSLVPELDPEIQEFVYNVESILTVRKRRNRLQ